MEEISFLILRCNGCLGLTRLLIFVGQEFLKAIKVVLTKEKKISIRILIFSKEITIDISFED